MKSSMQFRRLVIPGIIAACAVLAATAQEFLKLPEPTPAAHHSSGQSFAFATDGPIGPGWSRPDAIARIYVAEDLPTLFRRTLQLDSDIPARTKLSWIFTGPHGGITVEMTNSRITLLQRAYDSMAVYESGSYPDKTLRTDERTYVGHASSITVIVDAHLSVQLLVNGVPVFTQPFVYDLTRQQLMFSGPRNEHLTISGTLLHEQALDSVIHVSPERTHQTIIGFGGSPSIPAYEHLSDEGKRIYWDILRRYNLLIDREYPMGSELKPDLSNADDLQDATPHYYGDNFPNGEVSSFDYMRHTRELGGQILYEMWALPHWAVQAYTPQGKPIIDAWGKSVKTAAKPEVYAKIVTDFCIKAKQQTDTAPEIIGIQNEVEQAPEIYSAMTTAVRKALDAAGFTTTKIQMADAPYVWMALNRISDEKRFPQAWSATDFVASHQYDVQEFLANPDLYDERLNALHQASDGKPFLATEICLNAPTFQEPSYRLALQIAQLYQKDLVDADAEMLLYCWLILDIEQPTFGSSRSLLIPDREHSQVPVASSFQLRVLGAFSRHILKGMHRVETSSPNSDLLTSAFTDGNHQSLVVLNRSTSPQKLNIDWPGIRWTSIERTSFYSENVEAPSPNEVIVVPGELVTLSNFKAQ
jgi:O-glycosyl hydrolase